MYAQKEKLNESSINVAQKKTNSIFHDVYNQRNEVFVDNRFGKAFQNKLLNIGIGLSSFNNETCNMRSQYTKQLYKVSDDHIRADLRHPDHDRLFLPHTIEDVESVLNSRISSLISNDKLEEAVRICRGRGMMDYNVLSDRKITSEKQITKFLDENEEDEHMYVLNGKSMHVAIRGEGVKLPHPTLVGGDPDVDCAGTMRWDVNDEVIVDDGSGHFRPKGAHAAKKFVDKIMHKTAGNDAFKKKVKSGKRH